MIWRSEDVVACNDFSGLRDLYCRLWMETDSKKKRDTDTHWRCKNGSTWKLVIRFPTYYTSKLSFSFSFSFFFPPISFILFALLFSLLFLRSRNSNPGSQKAGLLSLLLPTTHGSCLALLFLSTRLPIYQKLRYYDTQHCSKSVPARQASVPTAPYGGACPSTPSPPAAPRRPSEGASAGPPRCARRSS